MKLDHPYRGLTGGQWLRGNMHTHTTQSDGAKPPQHSTLGGIGRVEHRPPLGSLPAVGWESPHAAQPQRQMRDRQQRGLVPPVLVAGPIAKDPAIDAGSIGHPDGSQIVLGKLSGRAGFAARAAALGFRLGGEALERAFRRFQAVADRLPEVDDATLRAICGGSGPGGGLARSPGFALDL